MNRDAILAANSNRPLKTITVHVTEWGSDVTIRELSAAQARFAFAQTDKLNTYLTLASLINDDGSPVFKDCPEDVAMVENMPHVVIRTISDAVIDLNGFKSVIEDREKNSPASQS